MSKKKVKSNKSTPLSRAPWRDELHEIIFGTDTPAGKLFDVILLWVILASVLVVMLETVDAVAKPRQMFFFVVEWGFTIFFTVEYVLRIITSPKPKAYVFSFFGIIDLLAIIPTYIELFLTGGHYLLVIRVLRLFRVFRIFKLAKFLKQSNIIVESLKASREKITVFLVFITLLTVIVGAVMFIIEGETNREFSSIPKSIYWAIVTLTTVGYGDISPDTPLGQFLAAVIMIMGYVVIAVPTGIVSAELVNQPKRVLKRKKCDNCGHTGHRKVAKFCEFCGERLEDHLH